MSTNITVNAFQKFKQLIPSGQRTYGEVVSLDAVSGTAEVELSNGSRIRAKGSAAVGDRVLVVDSEIRQTVPSLPFSNIELF
ncbi:MAG: hypothetical protein AAGI24_04010 [Pseudomonadota bacterium]